MDQHSTLVVVTLFGKKKKKWLSVGLFVADGCPQETVPEVWYDSLLVKSCHWWHLVHIAHLGDTENKYYIPSLTIMQQHW